MSAPYLFTKLHVYRLATASAEYRELFARLTAEKRHELHALEMPGERRKSIPPGVYTVALDPKHLFGNQWNTADDAGDEVTRGWRLFDWYEAMTSVSRGCIHTGRGHWLEITPAMREILRNTNACGYCGHQEEAQRGLLFCDRCLGSRYLKREDLRLLRMRSVEDRDRYMIGRHSAELYPELSVSEWEHLFPQYQQAQREARTKREAQRLVDARTAADQRLRAAQIEHKAYTWLIDHGFDTDNVIYYNHTGRFCFGWREPLKPEEKSRLLDVLSEFPFDYDLKDAPAPRATVRA